MIHPAPAVDSETEHAADLLRLRDLLERGDVNGARSLIKELEPKWPDSSRVRHLSRVLAPPQGRTLRGQKGRSRHAERQWLHHNAKDYPGCWLALDGDRLIAADPDLKVVLDAIDQVPHGTDPLLLHQPGA